MANTYTQIHIHVVFAVKFRDAAIQNPWKHDLYKYVTGIVQNNGHKLIAINGMSDHVHILIGMRPVQSLSVLMQDIKANSSRWVNEKQFVKARFEWQEGYGAFSYAKSQLGQVIRYIENQEEHHRKRSFREEYLEFLEKFEVDYNEQYIFNDML